MSDVQTRFFPCETTNRSNNPIVERTGFPCPKVLTKEAIDDPICMNLTLRKFRSII